MGIIVGLNLLFNMVYDRWTAFLATIGFVLGALTFLVLDGNRLLRELDPRPWAWTLIGGAAGAAVLAMLGAVRGRTARPWIGLAGCGGFGVLVAVAVDDSQYPGLDWGKLLVCTGIGAAIGLGAALVRRRTTPHALVCGAIVGAAVGWLIGAWGGADLGDGTVGEALIATAVPLAAIGARIGLSGLPSTTARREIEVRSRAWIFVTPTLLLVAAGLIVPLVRTVILSFKDRNGEENVGWLNYGDVIYSRRPAVADQFVDAENWFDRLIGSQLWWVGVAVVGVGVVLGVGRRAAAPPVVRRRAEQRHPDARRLLPGGLRGVRHGSGNAAEQLVVDARRDRPGDGVGTRRRRARRPCRGREPRQVADLPADGDLLHRRRDHLAVHVRDEEPEPAPDRAAQRDLGRSRRAEQLAVAMGRRRGDARHRRRACWCWRGRASPRARARVPDSRSASLVLFGLLTFLLLVPGIGGFVITDDGEVEPQVIDFIREQPYNNMWLMVVLIWLQVGFAMVIFSSAIKAVPTELTEAARIDGANESQVFWKVTLPQIAPTIGVVTTTILVLVLKVFDIVKVMTGGLYGTQVIANQMANAVTDRNSGIAAAFATLLFIGVLPVMFYNLRRMRRAGL